MRISRRCRMRSGSPTIARAEIAATVSGAIEAERASSPGSRRRRAARRLSRASPPASSNTRVAVARASACCSARDRVLREQALAELVMAALVGLDVLAIDPHGLVVAARRAERHEVLVDRVRDRLERDEPAGDPLDGRAQAAQVLEQRVRGGRRVAVDIEAERAQPIGDEVEVVRLVAALARERELDVELRRGRDPERRELGDVDLVRERDLEQRLRIGGDPAVSDSRPAPAIAARRSARSASSATRKSMAGNLQYRAACVPLSCLLAACGGGRAAASEQGRAGVGRSSERALHAVDRRRSRARAPSSSSRWSTSIRSCSASRSRSWNGEGRAFAIGLRDSNELHAYLPQMFGAVSFVGDNPLHVPVIIFAADTSERDGNVLDPRAHARDLVARDREPAGVVRRGPREVLRDDATSIRRRPTSMSASRFPTR